MDVPALLLHSFTLVTADLIGLSMGYLAHSETHT